MRGHRDGVGLDESRWQRLVASASALVRRGPKGDVGALIIVRYVLTGGERNDITQARALVRAREGNGVVGDRACDFDAFLAHVRKLGMRAVIPSRADRKHPRRLDRTRYARRNVVERWFGRVKAFRRIATRYDKTSTSYAGFVAAAAPLVVLTGWPA